MKRIFTIIILALFVSSLVGCGSSFYAMGKNVGGLQTENGKNAQSKVENDDSATSVEIDKEQIKDNQDDSAITDTSKGENNIQSQNAESNQLPQNIEYIESESKKNEDIEHIIVGALKLTEDDVKGTRYYYNYVNLNSDKIPEIFVQLVGPYTSGTGGDTGFILIKKDKGYEVMQQFTLIRNPLIISDEKTNGWNNIIMQRFGGGIAAEYVQLEFDGKKYTNVNEAEVLVSLEYISGTGIISNDFATDIQNKKGLYLSVKQEKDKEEDKNKDKDKGKDKEVISHNRVVDPKKPMVALTFDDGPHPKYTMQILNTLKKYNGVATFFMLGSRAGTYKDVVKSVIKSDCQIGNHTYNHKDLTKLSNKDIKWQISKTNEIIRSTVNITPQVTRPTYGAMNSNMKAQVGMPMILWSIDTLDWKTKNVKKTVSAVMNTVKDGDVVLMHDIYRTTADAADTIIKELSAKGYQLVTIDELYKARGKTLKNGVSYHNAYQKKK